MIRLTIESRAENVSLIGGAVRGIADMLSFDTISSYHLELCVVEAVTNVAKHAYHSEAGHLVEVDILIYRDRLTVKICDSGDRMDLTKIEPLAFDPSEKASLPERGMGVFILKSIMDEISYDIVGGRNILTLTKYLKNKDRAC
jgi:serine/threonine-protein kinase RsbW